MSPAGAVQFVLGPDHFAGHGDKFCGDPDALPLLWFDSPPQPLAPERFARFRQMETNPMSDTLELQRAAEAARDRCIRENTPSLFSKHYETLCAAFGLDPNARCAVGPDRFSRGPSRHAPRPVTTQIPPSLAAVRDKLLAEGGVDRGGSLAARFQREVPSLR